jgi:hypothetical protein
MMQFDSVTSDVLIQAGLEMDTIETCAKEGVN